MIYEGGCVKEFFKKLTENILSHDNIVIMTHKCPDLDGMGSAIAFNEILKKLGKKSCIVAPKSICDKSLNKTIKYLNDKKYVIPFKYEKKINDKNTFLIIFDTGEDVLTESEDVLNKIKDRCVIDHHTMLCNKICFAIFPFIINSFFFVGGLFNKSS